jgi:hypothetical protein
MLVKSNRGLTMSHAQLVQAATDLLSDCEHPDYWLPRYDAALATDSDAQLKWLVKSLVAVVWASHSVAA